MPRARRAGWRDPRHRLGLTGESTAIRWLVAQGWVIEAHRFRVGRNEIDLVARRDDVVAFIEVKTRRGSAFGCGREAVGWRKRQAVGRVAEVWRQRFGRAGDRYRFDLIEVLRGPGESARVEHLMDAWRL